MAGVRPSLLTHLCMMYTLLLDALGTLLRGLGECVRVCARRHTHTHTESPVTFLSHTPGNGLRWTKDRCPELYKSSWRDTPAFFHPQAISTPAALHSLSCLPLIWYFHKDDICIRQSRKCPGSAENSFLTGVTSNLHRPASDVLTIQLTSTSHWVGAST